MSRNQQIIIQVLLSAIQILVPAFVPHLSGEQLAAIAGFVASVQAIIGITAHSYTTSGAKIESPEKGQANG